MGSFGDRLQREREMRGITLEEIAEATKIGTRSLRALEDQDFDKLPGGIFNKGFVRAYARYLGLDEDQAVTDYLAALGEAMAAGKATRQEPANAAAPERDIFVTEGEEREPIRLPLGLIAVVVVVAVLLFSGWRYLTTHGLPKLRHVRAAGQPQSQPVPKAPAPADASSSGANAVATPDASHAVPKPVQPGPADGFVVRVKAKESSWISIVADGKPVMSGVLPMDAEKSIHAKNTVVLKIGNAAGIELFHNGKLVPSPGGGGEVKTVEFTSAGVRP